MFWAAFPQTYLCLRKYPGQNSIQTSQGEAVILLVVQAYALRHLKNQVQEKRISMSCITYCFLYISAYLYR